MALPNTNRSAFYLWLFLGLGFCYNLWMGFLKQNGKPSQESELNPPLHLHRLHRRRFSTFCFSKVTSGYDHFFSLKSVFTPSIERAIVLTHFCLSKYRNTSSDSILHASYTTNTARRKRHTYWVRTTLMDKKVWTRNSDEIIWFPQILNALLLFQLIHHSHHLILQWCISKLGTELWTSESISVKQQSLKSSRYE